MSRASPGLLPRHHHGDFQVPGPFGTLASSPRTVRRVIIKPMDRAARPRP